MDRDLYRALAGSFPTGVCVVTTLDADGAPKGLTTQSFVGLSTDPPLMLVSVDKTSRTLPALRHTGAFVVNFLKSGSESISNLFASKADDKFGGLQWSPAAGARQAPVLAQHCVAYAACIVTDTVDAGDHVIFIGRVEDGAVLGGAPLMYYRRTYAAWPEEQPAPPAL